MCTLIIDISCFTSFVHIQSLEALVHSLIYSKIFHMFKLISARSTTVMTFTSDRELSNRQRWDKGNCLFTNEPWHIWAWTRHDDIGSVFTWRYSRSIVRKCEWNWNSREGRSMQRPRVLTCLDHWTAVYAVYVESVKQQCFLFSSLASVESWHPLDQCILSVRCNKITHHHFPPLGSIYMEHVLKV